MNRGEIKTLAKEKIKGNKWDLIWPLLVIGVITSIIGRIFGTNININVNGFQDLTNYQMSATQSFGSILTTVVTGVLTAGYIKYVINFIRTGKFESNDIIETIKEKWTNILIAVILVTIIVGLCTLVFIVPGIIMAMAYIFTTYLVVDTDVKGQDALKKSREMMKGYKWDYFVFLLSFIGWFILVPFTLGILLIWLIPYMNVAEVLYYERLKEKKKID